MIRRFFIVIFIVFLLATPVLASEIQVPKAPESAQAYMPKEPETFSEGFLWILQQGIRELSPSLTEAIHLCCVVIVVMILTSFVRFIPGASAMVVNLVSALAIAGLLLNPSKTFIHVAVNTIHELQEYGKLLLPVMTTALAAQGGATGAAAIYAGTAIFNSLLTAAISSLIVPMIYIYLCLSVAGAMVGEKSLDKIKGFVKWLMTWLLKTILYVFTGYIGITGVVSGTTDAAALKAAKLTISGVIPVVGNILSDASEAVLVSAGVVKNAAGIYGLLTVMAIYIGPFLKIGVQYLILKFTAAICDVFGSKQAVSLTRDFSGALGLLVAMTGTVCLLFLISTVCFMRGMNL